MNPVVAAANTVGWAGLAVSLTFVAVAIALTTYHRLHLARSIVVAVVRSLGQMAIVGAALVPIVDTDTPLVWSWVWVAVVVGFSSVTITRRAPHIPGLLAVALLANVAVAAIGLSVIFGFGVFDLDGRSLVPVAGMVIGNSMQAAVIAATRTVEFTAEHRREIEAGLALGMTVVRASRRLTRSMLRTAISAQVERTAALGIVILPGAMTGLILAGADPADAVRAQLALMYVILAGVVVAAVITGLGTIQRLTTPDQTLRHIERRA